MADQPESPRRRRRRRAGVRPESFASRRSRAAKRPSSSIFDIEKAQPESPSDETRFDEDFWLGQRPPHWG